MPDPAQLPYLLQLLEDDSLLVQKAIFKELSDYGETLKEEIAKLSFPLSLEQERRLLPLYQENLRHWIKREWKNCFRQSSGENEQLEEALTLLATFQSGCSSSTLPPLKELLDQLASEYQATYPHKDALVLSHFLFEIKALKGAEKDYYHPQKSNLVAVIQEKSGIPISLACIYILVGHRLGLNIQGCNFPGHFLAKTFIEEELFLIDCFNGGQILDERHILAIDEESSKILYAILHTFTNAKMIIRRVLRNLIHAYQEVGEEANSVLMLSLLEQA